MNELLAAIEVSLRECLRKMEEVRCKMKLRQPDEKDEKRICEIISKINEVSDTVLELERGIEEVELMLNDEPTLTAGK